MSLIDNQLFCSVSCKGLKKKEKFLEENQSLFTERQLD